MFPADALQTIAEDAQDIASLCETHIKAVCSACGGTGTDPDTGIDPPCNECRGTGKGQNFHALGAELQQRNAIVQTKVMTKLREKKNGKKTS